MFAPRPSHRAAASPRSAGTSTSHPPNARLLPDLLGCIMLHTRADPLLFFGVVTQSLTRRSTTVQKVGSACVMIDVFLSEPKVNRDCEHTSEIVQESTAAWSLSGLSSQSLAQLLIHSSTVANGHQANDSYSLINGINDAKAANAILS